MPRRLYAKQALGGFRVLITTSTARHRRPRSSLARPALAQEQDFSAVEIETHPPRSEPVHADAASGGNIALSTGADGSVLVDTQFAPLNAKILAAVRAAGGSDVKYVINTHWHGDHTGGNEPLGKAGAVIIAHDNVLARMSTEQFMAAFNQTRPALAGGRAARRHVPDARDVPLERQHRERRARRERAHRRRLDRALHELERDPHGRHVHEGRVSRSSTSAAAARSTASSRRPTPCSRAATRARRSSRVTARSRTARDYATLPRHAREGARQPPDADRSRQDRKTKSSRRSPRRSSTRSGARAS